ncbi:TPA: hypothetical protein ACGWTM_002993 [Legionella pneumophila]
MPKDDLNSLRDIIFKHFELHATQRINLFRFYIGFIVLYLYGIGYISIHLNKTDIYDEGAALIISVLFIFITFIFKKLDKRNRDILDNSRKSLIYLESRYIFDEKVIPKNELEKIQVFHQDKNDKDNSYFTHSKCFKMIYSIGFGLGSVIIFVCLLRMDVIHYIIGFFLCHYTKDIS